ncbi:MAG: hypothetical protein HY359_13715 [Candidatus Rokubacteria bacterium]|nr:hypothetical protein [Candidatus Rokubacteria bacterium]
METLGRLFVGIGFLWVAIILLWAFAAGVDQPYAWFKWANEGLGYGWMNPTYLILTLFVVPMGMLVFLRDIMGDPLAVWVKWAAPGAFLAVYAFFLLAALPDAGRPLFFGIESVFSSGSTAGGDGPGSTTSWLVRLGIAIAVLGGVPGVLGFVVGMLTGSKTGARRR